MAKPTAKTVSKKLDLASVGGVVIALGAIVGGLVMEGGKIGDIAQLTAAMIVLGGTLGATMINTPMSILVAAIKKLPEVFFEETSSAVATIETLVTMATKARKNGLVSLENDVDKLDDPFMKKALSLAVDGTDLQELRKMMMIEICSQESEAESHAKVYETAGGYSPTIGIIGAVLGLIQVMKQLENIEEVGRGIAVAFVATVYGVALANIFLLPAGSKIKAHAHHAVKMKELILEGVCSVVEGLNPKLIRTKLEGFAQEEAPQAKSSNAGTQAGQPAPART